MSPSEPLGGALWWRPGHARPHNLRSTRPDWVGRITRGLPASRLPATLASLFSLCGHAHSACAGMAVNAALGRADEPRSASRRSLALQTLREHLRRMALDWPRQLATEPMHSSALDAAAGWLSRCPAFAEAPAPGATAAWLQADVLGMAPADWLAAWEHDPAAWLAQWCERGSGPLAQRLQSCRPIADTLLPTAPALRLHADAEALRCFASHLRDDSAFARRPRWHGRCAETGVWTRLNETAPQRLNTAWLRLGARLAECVRLALPDAPARCGAQWLSRGVLPIAPFEAIAWVEMARGLLLHHVQLDGSGDSAHVAACHVIAPTEWNFDADGAVARMLERLPRQLAGEGLRRLDALMAAYDPCVPHRQDLTMPEEAAHA
ncbi:MAG: hydrogenase formation protein [Leptothrix sp. (in: Bacteria)]|nr:hydrogenase formation protein [Leptothrix sp. (in: b-proteobacteria)]